MFWGVTNIDLQGQIWLKKENHNHHITTKEPWVPVLLPGLDCFMVAILYTLMYTYTVSRSQLFHSLNLLHVYWSKQPRAFRCLMSVLYFIRTLVLIHSRRAATSKLSPQLYLWNCTVCIIVFVISMIALSGSVCMLVRWSTLFSFLLATDTKSINITNPNVNSFYPDQHLVQVNWKIVDPHPKSKYIYNEVILII